MYEGPWRSCSALGPATGILSSAFSKSDRGSIRLVVCICTLPAAAEYLNSLPVTVVKASPACCCTLCQVSVKFVMALSLSGNSGVLSSTTRVERVLWNRHRRNPTQRRLGGAEPCRRQRSDVQHTTLVAIGNKGHPPR